MVEKNTLAGLRCNIFGTLACVEAAINSDVQSFIFISTDKAVRPTNIMGATKRFAELILQALATENTDSKVNTRISIVRFGNVLDSSGSVVPLFRQQIQEGGPVTVTDPKIIRYFMTITAASQLVIQAGAMESEGDIFVLDMGEQIQVVDLATDMIRLSGMTVRDEENPDGDIEIISTGLRPGEKLYEELLIGENVTTTENEKIMRVKEEMLEWDDLQQYLLDLELAIKLEDHIKIRDIFLNTVVGYNPENEIVDPMYLQKKQKKG
jgi:FlaA1/EpsC-like NDP-sugar epimerase